MPASSINYGSTFPNSIGNSGIWPRGSYTTNEDVAPWLTWNKPRNVGGLSPSGTGPNTMPTYLNPTTSAPGTVLPWTAASLSPGSVAPGGGPSPTGSPSSSVAVGSAAAGGASAGNPFTTVRNVFDPQRQVTLDQMLGDWGGTRDNANSALANYQTESDAARARQKDYLGQETGMIGNVIGTGPGSVHEALDSIIAENVAATTAAKNRLQAQARANDLRSGMLSSAGGSSYRERALNDTLANLDIANNQQNAQMRLSGLEWLTPLQLSQAGTRSNLEQNYLQTGLNPIQAALATQAGLSNLLGANITQNRANNAFGTYNPYVPTLPAVGTAQRAPLAVPGGTGADDQYYAQLLNAILNGGSQNGSALYGVNPTMAGIAAYNNLNATGSNVLPNFLQTGVGPLAQGYVPASNPVNSLEWLNTTYPWMNTNYQTVDPGALLTGTYGSGPLATGYKPTTAFRGSGASGTWEPGAGGWGNWMGT